MTYTKTRAKGRSFTLVETAVVLTIIVIILLVALPGLKGVLGSSAMQAASRQMYGVLSQARANAITTRKKTRVYFPWNKANVCDPRMFDKYNGGSLGTQLSKILHTNQSYIIADYTFDATNCASASEIGCTSTSNARGWTWVARTSWQFLPKGIVLETDDGKLPYTATTTNGVPDGPGCLLLTGGQTAFGASNAAPICTVSVSGNQTPYTGSDRERWVAYFIGADSTIPGHGVVFGDGGASGGNAWSVGWYIEFKPTGLTTAAFSLKIVEGMQLVTTGDSAQGIIYTNKNASGGPANYFLIESDLFSGRLRIQKPGGKDGGC